MRSVETRQLLLYSGFYYRTPTVGLPKIVEPRQPYFDMSDNNILFLIVNLSERMTLYLFFNISSYRFSIQLIGLKKIIQSIN